MKLKVQILPLICFLILSISCSTKKQVITEVVDSSKNQPNLIIIHTDEHSFRTLGCYRVLMTEDQANIWGKGNNVETPNIDRIADEGAIATSYYCASPVCTPSRASLLTGLYPQLTGAHKNGLNLRDDIPTFATLLQAQGYATSYVGKWHLAGHAKYQFGIEYKAGFEDNRYMMKGGHAPYLKVTDGNIKAVSGNAYDKLAADEKEDIFYTTDFFTDKALEILDRDKSKPFCLMLSIPDPHTPDIARPPYDKMFAEMDVQAPKTMLEPNPSWAVGSKNESTEFNAKALRNYFGMVKCIDDNVGRILSFLDENLLTDNTIIVFTSDHGDMFCEHGRKNKGVPYESSAKIPFVMRYPNKIKAGKVINTAYNNIDFTPTVLSLLGISSKEKFHGKDSSEDFLNNTMEINDDRITYFAKSGGWWVAAVTDRYKLILDKKEKPYLFDLEKDPDELINFYADEKYAEIVRRLQTELFVLMRKYNEPGLRHKTPYRLNVQ